MIVLCCSLQYQLSTTRIECENNTKVIGQHKLTVCVALPDIVSHTVDQSTASKSPALWCRLPDTPLKNSAAFSLHSYLIAVGGSYDNRRRTDIYLYQPESEQWTKVGDLPNAHKYCSCVVLTQLWAAGCWRMRELCQMEYTSWCGICSEITFVYPYQFLQYLH